MYHISPRHHLTHFWTFSSFVRILFYVNKKEAKNSLPFMFLFISQFLRFSNLVELLVHLKELFLCKGNISHANH